MTNLPSVTGVGRAAPAVRSGLSRSSPRVLDQVCLAMAFGTFLAIGVGACLWYALDVDQSPVLVLLGFVAVGLALCVPILYRLVPPPATPVPVAAQRVVPVAPEPLWRCLEPLPDDGSPLPEQVARRLAEAVDAGRLLPGSMVPVDQHIARHFKVSVGTVRRAKSIARSWGHLSVVHGGRLIVAARPGVSAVGVDP